MVDALGLTGVRAALWAEGVSAAYAARQEQRAAVFLTPQVDGWTLAVLGGGDLAEDDGTGNGALDLTMLSRRFGEAQKFSTHRVADYTEWQRWVDGLPVRRYCECCGDIRFDEGDSARAEGRLPHAANMDADNWEDFDFADESRHCRAGRRPHRRRLDPPAVMTVGGQQLADRVAVLVHQAERRLLDHERLLRPVAVRQTGARKMPRTRTPIRTAVRGGSGC